MPSRASEDARLLGSFHLPDKVHVDKISARGSVSSMKPPQSGEASELSSVSGGKNSTNKLETTTAASDSSRSPSMTPSTTPRTEQDQKESTTGAVNDTTEGSDDDVKFDSDEDSEEK